MSTSNSNIPAPADAATSDAANAMPAVDPRASLMPAARVSGEERASDFLACGTIRPVKLQASCLKLRHKLMYVDDRQSIPGLVDDSSDTRIFFCVKSQESLGPDGEAVSPRDCVAGRGCYCG